MMEGRAEQGRGGDKTVRVKARRCPRGEEKHKRCV